MDEHAVIEREILDRALVQEIAEVWVTCLISGASRALFSLTDR
jgi:hypothetical protein